MDAELLDLLQQDIYTDAHEYADRVRRVKELIAEEVKKAADQKSERNERIRGMAKDEWHLPQIGRDRQERETWETKV